MSPAQRVHDRALLDALEAVEPLPFEERVWRIARRGREALRGSAAQERWSLGRDSEVLYTSRTKEGALAEIGFRLSLEPIWPSKLEHELHEIAVKVERALHIAALEALAPLGVDIARYASFDYAATQAIAAAAYFLEFDGLIVPSARASSSNLMLFLDRTPMQLDIVQSSDVDWDAWRRSSKRGRT